MFPLMDIFQHLTQDSPSGEGHLLVSLTEQPLSRFEVTQITRQGTSLVLQCQPAENENDSETPSPRDESDHAFYTDDGAEPMSRHDPQRFYEDPLTSTTLLWPPPSGMCHGRTVHHRARSPLGGAIPPELFQGLMSELTASCSSSNDFTRRIGVDTGLRELGS